MSEYTAPKPTISDIKENIASAIGYQSEKIEELKASVELYKLASECTHDQLKKKPERLSLGYAVLDHSEWYCAKCGWTYEGINPDLVTNDEEQLQVK